MIKVLYETGIRLQELINLQIEHVNLEQGLMKVIGKGNKERIVFMGVKLRQELHRYIMKKYFLYHLHLQKTCIFAFLH